MPDPREVVLRHPDVKQPTIVSVAPGDPVPAWLRDAGWSIDLDTDPDAARAEQWAVAVAAAEERNRAAEQFVPAFPPAESESEPQNEQGVSAPASTEGE